MTPVRVDVVSIFPEYLAPLELSLIGKARRDGILDVRVHDLRDFAHDRHRTVDDSPFGGGAGMVMKPEPWAEALDAVVASGPRRGCRGAAPHRARAGRGAVQPGAGPLARRRAVAGVRLRALRGPRRAGLRARGDADAGHRRLARRLRAQRRRGGGAGDGRGRRAAAARGRRQRGVARRGVARGRPARVPRLHAPGLVGRRRHGARRARGAALRRPRGDRRVAARPAVGAHGRATPRPAAGLGDHRGARRPRRAGRHPRRCRGAARAAAGLLGA